jgi:L-malate glycosyltransferase
MNILRVCHIISGDLWAGAEAMAFELIKAQSTDSCLSVSVIVLNEGVLSRRLQDIGISTYVLSEKVFSWWRLAIELRGIVKIEKYHILHSHRYKENYLAFLAALRLPSVRLVATQHGMPEVAKSWKTRLFRTLNFLLLSKGFPLTVAVSREIRTIFVDRFGFKSGNIAIVHNGITVPKKINPSKERGPLIFGSAGRFFPVKNFPLMIEIARIVKANSCIKFKLAGDGPQRSILISLIREYGLEQSFELCGHQDNIESFYGQLDVFINTSFHEGIPMTVLEAMSFGIPIVGSKTGGIPEIIDDGKDGFLIQPGNAEGFAEKCLFLFRDEAMRKQMGAAAREKIIASFSIKSCAENYRVLYERVINSMA